MTHRKDVANTGLTDQEIARKLAIYDTRGTLGARLRAIGERARSEVLEAVGKSYSSSVANWSWSNSAFSGVDDENAIAAQATQLWGSVLSEGLTMAHMQIFID
ncbi:MAG: hypothetical protein EON57_03275, partial [Alphaproteobacteria bacterium]